MNAAKEIIHERDLLAFQVRFAFEQYLLANAPAHTVESTIVTPFALVLGAGLLVGLMISRIPRGGRVETSSTMV